MTTPKSTLKRLARLDPVAMAERIFKAEQRAEKLSEALKRIWEYPNAQSHHEDECELHALDAEDTEAICTCGYWSASFPLLKIEAKSALAADIAGKEVT